MGNSDRRELRRTFDEGAELYDRLRPGYPEELFDDLARLGALEPQAHLLEIGCGTGQATRSLATRGYAIRCLELGDSLTEVARRRLAPWPGVQVIASPFETWNPGELTFDMVVAATSWHWLDADTRYVKAARVLRPGGTLAIITTHHVLPDDGDPFFVEVQKAYDRIGEADVPPPHPEQVADERDDIEASGLFEDVRVRRYVWDESYTEGEYISLLDTYSGHRAMPTRVKQQLYEEIRQLIEARPQGRVRKHYLFTLHVASVRAQSSYS